MLLLIKKLWAMLLVIALSITFVSCISETGIDSKNDQIFRLESEAPIPFDNPLVNLRMDPEMLKLLSNLRKATAKYHRLEVAEENGYEMGSECVSVPGLGGMGYHFVNFPAITEGYDPANPQALLYEKTENGHMQLVAVEFVIDKAFWDAENDQPPFFGSREFDFDDAMALPFPNYQLHVWIWKNNPEGIFTQFNPKVSCE
ncbi:hypothetical protein QWY93_15435 [Echinicola jeungdonensis]|uniref:Uncharacterized protein n=1 Tax=Echinicola jeungdonensis TaxID=709343 RepID=A0ABV5J8N7_9BACT|nr:hypothetical protein [Echinicola jeungdonensis]MDN3670716.1 hypothetical protein [Echinicola jeungdonensis]